MKAKYLPEARLIAYLSGSSRIVASASKLTLSPKDFIDISSGMSEEKIEAWIKELVRRGHGSPLEHSIFIFEVACSRVCSHQLVRHRHASFSQLSQRYSDRYLRSLVRRACEHLGLQYREDYSYYVTLLEKFLESSPDYEVLLDVAGEAFIVPPSVLRGRNKMFLESLVAGVKQFYEVVSSGVPFEDARFLLPQAVKTRLLVSMNARELIEVFLPLRTCRRAQWEIRSIAWQILEELNRVEPALFKYSGPRCLLQDNRVRVEPCTLSDYFNGTCKPVIERCPELVPRDKIVECVRASMSLEVD
ncbi:MAG: FAD-dependent thymidylate synthase [Desulfurococcus sp.]|nr:FAD-dependent thymidylate synthase [Desulfurococcus sp.]